jgi:multidrug efflux system membrane fusion protein
MEADAPKSSSSRIYRRFWLALLLTGLGTTAYFCFFAYVGYTDDAYIRSDLIRIAPEVSGPVAAVHVRDNDHVEAGALLVTIDPKPFELAVDLHQDRVAGTEANIAVKVQALASQSANIQTAEAAVDLAQSEFKRVSDLAKRGFASPEAADKAQDALRSAEGSLALAKAQALVGEREVEEAKRNMQAARADLSIADYQLSRTRISASTAGYVNNFDIRVGRYAQAGEAIIGLVDDTQWRIIANFKEDVAASLRPDTPVWVWLDTRPWRLHRGHVESVARAIARTDVPGQLLPYVAPTTDWVRLSRRFPATILLDPPIPRDALFMGADARVLFLR